MSAYEVLGVPRDASEDAIRAAFRKAARRWHPDRCKEPKAAEHFMKAKNARDELLDLEQRRALDAKLAPGGIAARKRRAPKRTAGRRAPARHRTAKRAAAAPPVPPVTQSPPTPPASGLFAKLASLHARAEDMDLVSRTLWILLGAAVDQKLGTAHLTLPTPRG